MAINLKDLPATMQKQIAEKLKAAGGVGKTSLPQPKKNKLHAEKCGEYASKHEAARALELKMLERAGKISNLREQVKYVLVPAIWEEIPRTGKNGKPIKPKRVCVQRELSYIADFEYIDNETGEFVVEDAKGYKGGATYRIFVNKKKLMREKYGIEVKEV